MMGFLPASDLLPVARISLSFLRACLIPSQGKERHEKQHGHDGYVVRSRSNRRKLMPNP